MCYLLATIVLLCIAWDRYGYVTDDFSHLTA